MFLSIFFKITARPKSTTLRLPTSQDANNSQVFGQNHELEGIARRTLPWCF
jgi:hypothetical protein